MSALCHFSVPLSRTTRSHAENFATGVATIRTRCGSTNGSLRSFRQQLREALDGLKEAGVIHNWVIDAGDRVHIDRTPSNSQIAHVLKKKTRQKTARPDLQSESPRKIELKALPHFKR